MDVKRPVSPQAVAASAAKPAQPAAAPSPPATPRPAAAPAPKPAAAAAPKSATAAPAGKPAATLSPADRPVLEQPAHPFEVFLAREFDQLVQRMHQEGTRLNVSAMTQIKVLVNMLIVRVAAFSVRANVNREDVLKVLDHFWKLQPRPAPPPRPATPPAGTK